MGSEMCIRDRILGVFFEPFFSIEQLQRVVEMFLACFMHFYFLTQSDDFSKSIAFAWWPFFPIFKMLSFCEYWLFFGAVFCIEQLQRVVETFLACFYAFLIFDLN